MSDSNASVVSRKRAKLSDQSPTSDKKAGFHASEAVAAALKNLDHRKKPVRTWRQLEI
jgi:hypothetical protein